MVALAALRRHYQTDWFLSRCRRHASRAPHHSCVGFARRRSRNAEATLACHWARSCGPLRRVRVRGPKWQPCEALLRNETRAFFPPLSFSARPSLSRHRATHTLSRAIRARPLVGFSRRCVSNSRISRRARVFLFFFRPTS